MSEVVLTHNENSYSVFISADDEGSGLREDDVCPKGASIERCSLCGVNFFHNTHDHKVVEMIEADVVLFIIFLNFCVHIDVLFAFIFMLVLPQFFFFFNLVLPSLCGRGVGR